MLFPRGDDTNPPRVVSSLDHAHRSDFELALVLNFPRLQVHKDGVVRLDVRIREPDRAAIVRGDVRVTARAELVRHHTAKLVRSLVLVNLVNNEAALGIVEEPKVLV